MLGTKTILSFGAFTFFIKIHYLVKPQKVKIVSMRRETATGFMWAVWVLHLDLVSVSLRIETIQVSVISSSLNRSSFDYVVNDVFSSKYSLIYFDVLLKNYGWYLRR